MRIIFTVTNDLSYDQRMQRICKSLASDGYGVLLVGRVLPHSIPLIDSTFQQKRLSCFFNKGFLFYAEYNIRLFFFLLSFRPYDAICSIDLDTLTAGFFASLIRRKKRVFDAHEYFTEVPELVGSPIKKSFWALVANSILPFYRHAYTVGPALAAIFERKYDLKFSVIRNVAARSRQAEHQNTRKKDEPKLLLYQGALNAGRGLEAAIQAMQNIDNVKLVIAGEGDLSMELRMISAAMGLEDKVDFKGFLLPPDLKKLTATAWLGLNLLENKGRSYYYSLANKFFDCVQAGVPIICMNFPEYKALNSEIEVAYLLDELSADSVSGAVNILLKNHKLYDKLVRNCYAAREVWTWENEERQLLLFWGQVKAEHAGRIKNKKA